MLGQRGLLCLLLFQIGDEVAHLDDGDDVGAVVTLHFLDGGELALALLLTIQGDQHPGQGGAVGLDQIHGFADGGPGGDDVVHQHDASLERAAYQIAAFAVILGLLAVEAPGHVHVVLLHQLHRGGRGDGDPLVGRAKQHVEFDAGIHQGGGIEAAEAGQIAAAVEQAGVEEVGALAAGFQGELTEFENLFLQGELDKLTLVGFHSGSLLGLSFTGVWV